MRPVSPVGAVSLAKADNDTSPTPGEGTGSQIWSTTTNSPMVWNGTKWRIMPVVCPPDETNAWYGNGTGSTIQSAVIGTNATLNDLLVAKVSALSSGSNSLSAPSGYTQLGSTQSGGGVLVGIFYRTASHTAADNCVATQANTTVMSVLVHQYANAGTPAGLTSSTFSSVTKWTAPSISATKYDLIYNVYLGAGAVATAQSVLPGWGSGSLTLAAGNSPTVLSKVAAFADSYGSIAIFGASQSGLAVAFRIPSAG